MFAKWRRSIDEISARSVLADEAGAAAGVERRRAVGREAWPDIDRVERDDLDEGRVELVGFAGTVVSLMTVVTVRCAAAAVAVAGSAVFADLSELETSMMTATAAPSSSAAIRPASVMIRPRCPPPPPCGCVGAGGCTGGGP
jgi:hypothetical protein